MAGNSTQSEHALGMGLCRKRKVFAWIWRGGYVAPMRYVGVDGCKAGWLAVEFDGTDLSWVLFSEFEALLGNYADGCCLFVDIPIGLPSSGTREADAVARKLLPSHLKSSIFNTPVRAAVYASDKVSAKTINKKLSGKSLSEQSLGIARNIMDVDQALQSRKEAWSRVFEAHPEVCFQQLGGAPLRYAKKDLLGGLERLRILDKFTDGSEGLLASVRETCPRTTVSGDDVLDACVLAVAAWKSRGKPRCLPLENDGPPQDETGLPMAIWFPA